MNCPFCGSSQIKVVNSRPTAQKTQIWRRRMCLSCGEPSTSYEKMSLSHILVIKKSGKKQRFDRAKLFAAIYRSTLDKRESDKGEMARFAEQTTLLVEREIVSSKRKEITSREITKMVLKTLGDKSPDTFLRFLAYREGSNLKLIKKLLRFYLKI